MAIEGANATLLSANRSVEVFIEKIDSNVNKFVSSASEKEFMFELNDQFEVEWIYENPMKFGIFLEIAIKLLGVRPESEKFSIDSSSFFENGTKIGIGSSSAISVAITRAMNKYFDLNLDNQKILFASLEIHNHFQNYTGSGLDVLSSFYSFPVIECSKSKDNSYKWSQLNIPDEIKITFVKGSASADTHEMIKRYFSGKHEHQKFFLEISKEMMESLYELSKAFKENKSLMILNAIKKYSTLMFEMDNTLGIGVYTDMDKEISILAKKEGLFYKPSGAGGGDLGIIIGERDNQMNEFINSLSKQKMKQIKLA